MGIPRISRRDFLKLVGATTLFLPASKLLAGAAASMRNANEAKTPSVIILLFDTLSARHMSLYGYRRKTTPNIDQMAKVSTIFHRHYAASSHTKPSTASLLTGVLPWSHRALNFYTALLAFYEDANIFGYLPSNYYAQAYTHNTFTATILEQFARHIDRFEPVEELTVYNPNKLPNSFSGDYPMGFYAAKRWRDNYMGPSNSLFLNPLFAIIQAIGSSRTASAYRDTYPLGLSDNQEGYLYRLEDAVDWIAHSAASLPQPYLMYNHLLPPHEAYRPRADFVGMFAGDGARLVEKPESFFTQGQSQAQLEKHCELYDEYIAFVDSEFGRLWKMLQAGNVLDNAWVILTSDHGQLFERGIHGHGTTLYESLIHIPLIIHAPGQTRKQDIHAPTSIMDILPTILQWTGQDLPEWLEGRPLPVADTPFDSERTIFAIEAKENHRMKPLTKATFSAIRWPYKLIRYIGYHGYEDVTELFHLENDPEELDNLASDRPAIVADLNEELSRNQSAAEERMLGLSPGR